MTNPNPINSKSVQKRLAAQMNPDEKAQIDYLLICLVAIYACGFLSGVAVKL